MAQQHDTAGIHPPQQARSRESQEKVLNAAEQVLLTGGIEEFTIAAVAEHAGVSVGAIYRRFTGKEPLLHAVKDQLLARLEHNVTAALAPCDDELATVLEAFAHALATTFADHHRVFPELLSGQHDQARERGLRTLATIQRAATEAAEPHLDEIRHPEPRPALAFALRTILGSCMHRAATAESWPDELPWTRWADETTTMAMTYLTSTRPNTPTTH
ncbi:TetR/AcrR family transcriptional regulator [Actinopolyspora saharensis]|uniref:TetR/AcrR family transcriptional regulator n=1 Tax=Actinopolyspora saharensis TaxID=995062 RepID=UPI003F661AAF